MKKVMIPSLDMKKSISVKVDSDLTLLLSSGVYEIKKMEPRRRLRPIVIVCLFLTIAGIVGFGYFCPDQVCALSRRDVSSPMGLGGGGGPPASTGQELAGGYEHDNLGKPVQQNLLANPGLSYEEVLNDDFQFDMNAHDVMVFLHIQKTGGTSFGKHLVRDLDLKRPCTCQRKKKRCYCFRPHRNENWLFSRYSTGWKCGLHADWTELTGCVDQELDKNEGETAKRRYFYITLLREPIARYLSEFRHVQRGATWKNARHWCLGRHATPDELPPCYDGANWNGVALDEFAGCESNLAANRQTRMLADLALVGCYNKTYMPAAERDRIMLASAKRNLAAMSYFGLTEYQKISQYIFEETFNLRFAIPFEQHNTTVSTVTMHGLTTAQRARIDKLNALDIELYAFAKKLMFQRFERLKAKDNDFEVRFAHLGNLGVRNGVTEFNWDSNIDDMPSNEHH
ncbi:heparan-sulfate 6-O-sulfotransferase 1 [Anopheles ziemanni]|uniref:heparan-sulfate 6-O-sulfotransferase 1 n=1 Tax=Anopheles coustani TaxID=139045 RepID=UPI0026597D05|nr:heparan-sulfate 6-O-sulfotransferase 1 [Anopheles coustani]XP_058129868.1 heparan-sulfate 6-O-sulfotransferase 1 [Anopheles coustani]XP_058129869.1 heparan-sulfate 6-O-sulfotransferase 1 [Anopheles coustani]XP_058172582.1 heparan-sulfate 6-O-sulfotransferase 1 [Anopheles ziemanni]